MNEDPVRKLKRILRKTMVPLRKIVLIPESNQSRSCEELNEGAYRKSLGFHNIIKKVSSRKSMAVLEGNY